MRNPRLRFRTVVPSLSLAALWALAATAQGQLPDSPKSAGQARSSDQQKIEEVEHQYKVVEQKVQQLEPQVHIDIRAQLQLEWANACRDADFVYNRLSNLKRLQQLRTEITALGQRKKVKSEALHKLEVEWDLKRSELLKTMVGAKMARSGSRSGAIPDGCSDRQRERQGGKTGWNQRRTSSS